MAGHSKWANIKHKKGAMDAKRNKIFTKLIREITIAAKLGPDLETNPRLRTVIAKAKSLNMPKDNIEKAIKKATGFQDSNDYIELVYEGYAPYGVAIIVNCLTDNKNRTASDVRSTLVKNGGSLGTAGSVSYMFKKQGLIVYKRENYSEDEIMEFALEYGAVDISSDENHIEVITEPQDLESIALKLREHFREEFFELIHICENKIKLDEEREEKVLNLIEKLEDFDDVQEVIHNLEITRN